jgi:cobalt-zinc-cadmium efflux system outer membrane protein
VFLPLRPFTPVRPGGPPELDVIATFPIDWYLFGKRAAAMVNAEIGVAVSNADYCDQVRQRLANTASAFYDVLEARAMAKLAEEDLASLERVEGITLAGVKFGGSGTIEAERIRLSVLDAQREVRARATTQTTSEAQLRAAIGRARQTPRFDVAGNLDVVKPAAPLSLSEAIAVAEQNRPDIISLQRQIARARSGVDWERTKARPTVSPSLGYQYQFQDPLGVADAPSYTAQMNVSVPIFDRNQGNIAKAESALAQSRFNLQAQLVQAEADIEQAVGEFQAAQTNAISIGPQQLAAARSVRDRTVTAYGLGGKTLLEVLDAQRAYRDTHRSYILGQSAYWHALHRLNAAVGQQVLP